MTSSTSAKGVPWKNWAEWEQVRKMVSSGDLQEYIRAVLILRRWSTRGRIPVSVDATLNFLSVIVEDDRLSIDGALPRYQHAEVSLRLSYGSAIVRFVNLLLDQAQRGSVAASMDSLAAIVDLPSWVVQIRHNASHASTLPSTSILRQCVLRIFNDFIVPRYWSTQSSVLEELTPDRTLSTSSPCDSLDQERISNHLQLVSAHGKSGSLAELIESSLSPSEVCSRWIFARSLAHDKNISERDTALFLDSLTRLASKTERAQIAQRIIQLGDIPLIALLTSSPSISPHVRTTMLRHCAEDNPLTFDVVPGSFSVRSGEGTETFGVPNEHIRSHTLGQSFIVTAVGVVPGLT